MKVHWVIDESTEADGDFSLFGHEVIRVNGTEVLNRWNLLSFRSEFKWPDGRPACMLVQPSQRGVAFVLTVDGVSVATTMHRGKQKCSHCGEKIASGSSRCATCGGAQPNQATLEQQHAQKQLVSRATAPLLLLALLATVAALARTVSMRSEWFEQIFTLLVAAGFFALTVWAKRTAALAAWWCGALICLAFAALAFLQSSGPLLPQIFWDVILAATFARAWPAAHQLSGQQASRRSQALTDRT